MIFIGAVLENQVAPVHVRIEELVGTVFEQAQLLLCVREGESIVMTGMIESVGVRVAVHHVCEFRVELELVAVVHLDVSLAFDTTLCLHKDGSIDTLITKKSGCGGILEDGYTLYFLYTEAVDRTLIAIDENQDALSLSV